jgi:hypothetical protein
VDESSDIYWKSYLAICATYFEDGNFQKPVTKLISILPITTSSTGEVLFKKIEEGILSDAEIT